MSELTVHLRRIASRGYTTDADNQELFDYADLIEAIDRLHTTRPDAPHWCPECRDWWPCRTARILHPEADGE